MAILEQEAPKAFSKAFLRGFHTIGIKAFVARRL